MRANLGKILKINHKIRIGNSDLKLDNFKAYALAVSGTGGQEEKYTPALNDLYNSIPNNTNFEIYLSAGSAERISGMKASDTYGYMERKTYSATKVTRRERVLTNGTWSNWKDVQ